MNYVSIFTGAAKGTIMLPKRLQVEVSVHHSFVLMSIRESSLALKSVNGPPRALVRARKHSRA